MFTRIESERLAIAKPLDLKELNRINTHKHARLTFARLIEMVRQMTDQGLSASQAAVAQCVTSPTVHK